ncbi:hypothetical protein C9J60_24900 [Streptomyces sp. A244]|nr:hypothetical protein C9J60_24900 [Streptomyces sp. A244]
MRLSLEPQPAKNDQPLHGCSGPAGAGCPAIALPVDRARAVLRPAYCRRPWTSYPPSSTLRGETRGPVAAPTIASVVSRTLYVSQPRTDG